MRLQISLPTETWERVKELADAERRPPKYQVEHLIIEALRTRQEEQATSDKEVAVNAR
jgi:predicted transcriptional regulator